MSNGKSVMIVIRFGDIYACICPVNLSIIIKTLKVEVAL